MTENKSYETKTEPITSSTFEGFNSMADECRTRLEAEGWEIMLDVDETHIHDDDGMHRGIIRAIRYADHQSG